VITTLECNFIKLLDTLRYSVTSQECDRQTNMQVPLLFYMLIDAL